MCVCVCTGPHCQGSLLLDSIQKNMRKEYTLEGVYQVRACVAFVGGVRGWGYGGVMGVCPQLWLSCREY